jgi:peroxiredoxin
MPLPVIGEPAPDFTAMSTSGELVTLSAQRGRTILLAFFPLAFSGTCTAQLCSLRDEWGDFAAHGVTVFPISVDSKYALKEYKAKHAMPVDLLSDFKRDISQAYGVLMPDKQYSRRSYFLIDRDGILRWSYVEEHNGLRRENAELLREIARVA